MLSIQSTCARFARATINYYGTTATVAIVGAVLIAGKEANTAGVMATAVTLLSTGVWYYFFTTRQLNRMQCAAFLALCVGFIYAPVFKFIAEKLDGTFWQVSLHSPFIYCVLRAGVVEELAKFTAAFFTLKFLMRTVKCNHFSTTLGVSVSAALAFAGYETFGKLQFLSQWTTTYAVYSIGVGALARIPVHALLAAMWAIGLGMSLQLSSFVLKASVLLPGLFAAMLFHGMWDYLAFFVTQDPVIAVIMFVLYVWFWVAYHYLLVSVNAVETRSARDKLF